MRSCGLQERHELSTLLSGQSHWWSCSLNNVVVKVDQHKIVVWQLQIGKTFLHSDDIWAWSFDRLKKTSWQNRDEDTSPDQGVE